MNTQTIERGEGREGRRVTGVVLVAMGLVVLAGQLLSLGLWVLPLLAVTLMAAGVATRQAGWMIPGGIIAGIGLGAFLIEGPLAGAGDPASGGAFLLAFAAGWASVYLFSRLFTAQPQGWALIPGGVMALIGGALLLGEGGERLLEATFGYLNLLWPLALILIGVTMLLRRRG